MMEFFEFMFSSFWVFVGMMMFIGVVGQIVVALFGVMLAAISRGRR